MDSKILHTINLMHYHGDVCYNKSLLTQVIHQAGKNIGEDVDASKQANGSNGNY